MLTNYRRLIVLVTGVWGRWVYVMDAICWWLLGGGGKSVEVATDAIVKKK